MLVYQSYSTTLEGMPVNTITSLKELQVRLGWLVCLIHWTEANSLAWNVLLPAVPAFRTSSQYYKWILFVHQNIVLMYIQCLLLKTLYTHLTFCINNPTTLFFHILRDVITGTACSCQLTGIWVLKFELHR
jgi:hypothetical protein